MKTVLIPLLLLTFFPISAEATLVKYRATGVITNIDTGLLTTIAIGDNFSFDIVFDSNAIDQNSLDYRGRYIGKSIDLSIREFQASTLGAPHFAPDIYVNNNYLLSSFDRYSFLTGFEKHQAPHQGDRELISIGAEFTDTHGTVFSSDQLPLTPPDLSEFETAELQLLFSNDYSPGIAAFDAKFVYGQITSLSAVPLPPSLALFLTSILGLFFARGKYRKSSP